MVSRIAGRLVTGPVAFFIGGLIDIAAYAALSAARRIRRLRHIAAPLSTIWRR